MGNDEIRKYLHLTELQFQSTFPRGERQDNERLLEQSFISIHVPAWGTTELEFQFEDALVFQSTFPRGERLLLPRSFLQTLHFNPRSRVGNDDHVR